MAIAGFAVGFILDEMIARLAREPYERHEVDEDDLRLKKPGAALELSSETGAFAMPRALTTGAQYRRIVVVAATALLFALVGMQYAGSVASLVILAAYVAVLIVCTGTDVLAYRVPNVITYPAVLGALAIGLVHPDANKLDVLVGGLLTGGVFLAMLIMTGGGMGMGDVKLAFFTGFALGLTFGVHALLLTALIGGAVAVALLVTNIRDRRDPIPYAPFIAIGAIVVFLLEGTAFAAV